SEAEIHQLSRFGSGTTLPCLALSGSHSLRALLYCFALSGSHSLRALLYCFALSGSHSLRSCPSAPARKLRDFFSAGCFAAFWEFNRTRRGSFACTVANVRNSYPTITR